MRESNDNGCVGFGGTGFLGLLGLLFIALKLCNVIDWNWCLVTLPLYIIPAILTVVCLCIAIFFGVVLFVGLCVGVVKEFNKKRK